ncbi:MAG: outer membrane protein assembly factor BamA [Thermodesulfobacteriota bacterium]|jgi:outer membrane protein insertion porin family|nr:outer membrane protein assembly factor BamA [Thermodesulfobacteriota bacterium]
MTIQSMSARILFFCLIFFGTSSLCGAALTFEDVLIEGLQRVEERAVRSVIQARPGQPLTLEDIDRDIRNIFSLGRFRDVTALTGDGSNGPILIYHVEERPLVREVRFTGNKEFKEDKLRELATVRVPDLYDPEAVEKSVEAIRQAYRDEGFHAAQIETDVEIDDQNEATVIFDIDEGEKILVSEIAFTGNKVFTDEELREFMQTREKWFLSWLTGRGTYNHDMLKNDLELIADEYFNRGYVQVKVLEPDITFNDDKNTMSILIEIEEGVQFRVGNLDIEGDLLESPQELLKTTKLQEGEVFSRKKLREAVFALNDLYADRGYAYVNVAPLTRLDQQKRLIHITFDIEKGAQVHIDRIQISGNSKTRDKVIRREMKLIEGELYSATKLKKSRQRINNLGYFEEVNVSTAQTDQEELMDIDVDVKERGTGTFSIGFGYSSVDGLIGQGSLQQDNFLGRGLRFDLSAALGGKTTTYRFGMTDPYFLDKDLTLGFDLYKTDREWPDFSEETTGGNLKFGFPLSDDLRAYFLYRYEDKKIYDVDPDVSRYILEQEGKSTLSSVTAMLRRDTTDYRLDPTKGSQSEASIEFAGIGGTEKFTKYILDHRHFFPFKWGTYFSAHGQVGYIKAWGGEDVPIDERFFLGGINSLRGFKSRHVGPMDEDDYIGGVKEAYFNFEYIFPLAKDMGLKGVVFFDTGNAWGDSESYFSDMRYNVGAGIRWFSPMGPLRLEWGYNPDPREDENSTEWQFSIGRFF